MSYVEKLARARHRICSKRIGYSIKWENEQGDKIEAWLQDAQDYLNAQAAIAKETGVKLTSREATEAMMDAAIERVVEYETTGFYDGIFAAMHDAAPAIPEGCRGG